uniref:Uncharacterized protein n=1 Tax=Glossina palpalis gambiensis TaxID=67801 RepID=A0A1B0AMZ6_9MUSC
MPLGNQTKSLVDYGHPVVPWGMMPIAVIHYLLIITPTRTCVYDDCTDVHVHILENMIFWICKGGKVFSALVVYFPYTPEHVDPDPKCFLINSFIWRSTNIFGHNYRTFVVVGVMARLIEADYITDCTLINAAD